MNNRRGPLRVTRRQLILGVLGTTLGLTLSRDERKTVVNVTIDYSNKIKDITPDQVGVTISTYGNNVVKSAAQAAALKALQPGSIRIPLQWNGGNVISSAGGGPRDSGFGDKAIDFIVSAGAEPVIVIGGSSDNNFTPADAAAMAKHYLGKVKHYVVGNEAGNGGMSISTYCGLFNETAKAIHAVDPSLKVIGPAWAYFDHGNLTTFIANCKGNYDLIDYHHYGMGGGAAIATDAELAATSDWHNEVSWIRSQLDAQGGQKVGIQVGEYNWAWRFGDGYNGGNDTRFFHPEIIAWSASLIGQVLTAGGRSFAYSDQNGPLGIMVEPGNNDQGKPGNTPQPIYWGIAAWTGAGGQPKLGAHLYSASADSASVEAYATDTKIILINKTSTDQPITINAKGATLGNGHVTSSSDGYGAPSAVSAVQLPSTLKAHQVLVMAVTLSSTPVTPPVNPTPPVTPTGTSVVLDGAVIEAAAPARWVNLVQRLLIKAGYTDQQVNGGYGVTTTANVKDFQTKHALPVTGIVDEATLDKLIG